MESNKQLEKTNKKYLRDLSYYNLFLVKILLFIQIIIFYLIIFHPKLLS
jgi:hypothetical protein